MKKIKYLYKITYSKSRESREILIIISIITAMVIVFTTMSASISFAYQALAMKSDAYDISVLDVSFETVDNIIEKIESQMMVKFSSKKTEQVRFYFENEDFFTDLIGAEGDYLEIYGEKLIEGKLPQNQYEILLDQKYISQTGQDIKIGTQIKLYRDISGYVSDEEHIFTVVGIIESSMHDNIFDVNAYTSIGTIEKILSTENMLYGYMMCTDGNDFETLDQYYATLYEVASSELLNSDEDGRILMNEEKYMLYQDKYLTESSFGKAFMVLAYIVGIVSSFMIYNAISVSTNEKIRLYGILQSLGLSKGGMLVNMFVNTILSGMQGIALGCLLGFVLNHSVGVLLMNSFNKGLGSSSLIKFDVVDRPLAYLQSAGIVFVVLLVAQFAIAIQIKSFTVIDAVKYNGMLKKVKSSCKKTSCKIKNIIPYIGGINLSRNKLQYFYTFLTLFFSVTLLMSVVAFFGDMDVKDFDAYKKAGFCDYEFRCATNNPEITQELIDEMQIELNVSEVYGLRYSAWEVFTEDSESHNKKLQNVDGTNTQILDQIMQEYLVAVFVTEDEVLEEIIIDQGIDNYNLEEPYVLINASSGFSEEEILIYKEDKEILVPLNGKINNNYILDGQILCNITLTMNQEAFETYLQMPLTYTGILVTSNNNQDVVVDEVRDFLNSNGIESYFKNCYEEMQDIKNQGINLMIIAGYLMLCVFIMCIVNCVNIMRIIVKQRRKEFGILMTLGMSRKDSVSLLCYEIRFITGWAVCLGMFFSVIIVAYMTAIGNREISWGGIWLIVILIGILFYVGIWYITKHIGERLIQKNIKNNLEESYVSN